MLNCAGGTSPTRLSTDGSVYETTRLGYCDEVPSVFGVRPPGLYGQGCWASDHADVIASIRLNAQP